jgi:adenylate cyclase
MAGLRRTGESEAGVSETFELKVYDQEQLVYTEEFNGALELGRQGQGENGPYSHALLPSGIRRLIMARFAESSISRKHLLVEPLPGGHVRLTNLSSKVRLPLSEAQSIMPGATEEIAYPVYLTFGTKKIALRQEESELLSLDSVTRAPVPSNSDVTPGSLSFASGSHIEPEALVRWLQSAMDVIHSAASSSDFFLKAAQAVVKLVGLDSGRVLLLEKAHWRVAAFYSENKKEDSEWQPSRKLLAKLREDKKTLWREAGRPADEFASLVDMTTIVAAPILDRQGEAIGALYGHRSLNPQISQTAKVTKLQALLVELLAMGVAAGLARMEQEAAAVRGRIQFEQFFSPELARHLAEQPDLLQARNREVTLLFCDIRGFSRISERVGAEKTVEWVSDVMETLSACVRQYQGVPVDFIGDEMIAMWGAPDTQPDHPKLACRAALAMQASMTELNARWQSILGEEMSIGIGINTGVAQVGNVGSKSRFKYGALGSTVNLASRVQGVTKHLRVKLLVTSATQRALGEEFTGRRLGRVRVVNIAEPVDLYELVPGDTPNWKLLCGTYEKGLAEFEQSNFREAGRILGGLQLQYPGDGPSLILLSRTVNYLIQEPATFDAVWEMPGK